MVPNSSSKTRTTSLLTSVEANRNTRATPIVPPTYCFNLMGQHCWRRSDNSRTFTFILSYVSSCTCTFIFLVPYGVFVCATIFFSVFCFRCLRNFSTLFYFLVFARINVRVRLCVRMECVAFTFHSLMNECEKFLRRLPTDDELNKMKII